MVALCPNCFPFEAGIIIRVLFKMQGNPQVLSPFLTFVLLFTLILSSGYIIIDGSTPVHQMAALSVDINNMCKPDSRCQHWQYNEFLARKHNLIMIILIMAQCRLSKGIKYYILGPCGIRSRLSLVKFEPHIQCNNPAEGSTVTP